MEICERLSLHKPIVEQSEYNMFTRDRLEKEYRRIYSEYKYGTTIWSPLSGGLLSGKYNDGVIPEGSRYDNHKFLDYKWQKLMGPENKDKTCAMMRILADYAKELGFSQAQLALAWCIANRDVTTALLGFTRLEQVDENLKAIELY
jgi:aryl-alcohol dehydrogenase-like predicted oxidoreductase